MCDFIKKHGRELSIGVVSSFTATFIIQVGSWIKSTAPKVGSSITETVGNFIYALAATRINTMVVFFILTFLGLVCGFFVSVVSLFFGEEIEIRRRIPFRFIKNFISSIIICFHIILMLFVVIPTNLCEIFERDIAIIYPYVEEKEIFQLKSDWALMKSQDDYLAIQEYIHSVKEEHSLFR